MDFIYSEDSFTLQFKQDVFKSHLKLYYLSLLCYPVSSHAGVTLAVASGRPQEQSRCHHLQREGDESQVQRPAH